MHRELVRNIVDGRLGVRHRSTPMAGCDNQDVIFPIIDGVTEEESVEILGGRINGRVEDAVAPSRDWTSTGRETDRWF